MTEAISIPYEGAFKLDYLNAFAQFHRDMTKALLAPMQGYDPKDHIGINIVAEIAANHPPAKFTGDTDD